MSLQMFFQKKKMFKNQLMPLKLFSQRKLKFNNQL